MLQNLDGFPYHDVVGYCSLMAFGFIKMFFMD